MRVCQTINQGLEIYRLNDVTSELSSVYGIASHVIPGQFNFFLRMKNEDNYQRVNILTKNLVGW